MSRQKNFFCWLEKQWFGSCKTPSLTRWKGRYESLTRRGEHMFFFIIDSNLVLLSSENPRWHETTNVASRNYCLRTSSPTVWCADNPTHTQSRFRVDCVRILSFTWCVCVRTFSTSLLLTIKVAPTFDNLHQILAFPLQTFSIFA